ncbi:MAG: CDGSH iron-sulfur domain-containing protein [Cyclobacteriaceae bacterium]|jgi:CDGSH-type Zn-finger protein|nr:CDGSH iron-sulfur domain-containing protein [Cyclobacteriaceae bacterium]
MPNGPIIVKGSLNILYKGADELKENKVTALCRCGASGNKPFCDGSHGRIGFAD